MITKARTHGLHTCTCTYMHTIMSAGATIMAACTSFMAAPTTSPVCAPPYQNKNNKKQHSQNKNKQITHKNIIKRSNGGIREQRVT